RLLCREALRIILRHGLGDHLGELLHRLVADEGFLVLLRPLARRPVADRTLLSVELLPTGSIRGKSGWTHASRQQGKGQGTAQTLLRKAVHRDHRFTGSGVAAGGI